MFAELLCRSHGSFLRGASSPEELIATAGALGYAGLAICDRDGVYSLPKAHWKAQRLAEEGLPNAPLLCGAELTLAGMGGLSLVAQDRPGWALLCNLISASHRDKSKGAASLDWPTFLALTQGHAGRTQVLALPRGAGLGESFPAAAHGALKDLFGRSLFIPLGRFVDGRDKERTQAALALSQTYDAPLLATNDAHYHVPQRAALQDTLACVREHCTLQDAGFRVFGNSERHLRPLERLRALYGDLPWALQASVDAAASCGFSLAQLRYRYPSEWIPTGHSSQSWLAHLGHAGLRQRFPRGAPDSVRAQLLKELALVEELGYADYFLTVEDAVRFARSRRILCQGRGAAANSVLCYCLGVTSVDPTRIGLLFERFLSKERHEPPDIDIDFEHERREEVIQYLYAKYGRERAAMVATSIKYRSRSAVADFSKALGRPARLGPSLRDAKLEDHEPQLRALAEQARDVPRHLGIHSGGFVLSDGPLIDLVPVEPARMEGRTIIQWDKYDLDYVGLMKVDLLGLGMLSCLRRSLDHLGLEDLDAFPEGDAPTYAMIQRADTVGVFQIESRAQMNMLGRLKPAHFYDLVIEVALVRPGPILGKMVHPYLRRRKGEEPVRYEHPALKAILEKTLGVPLFQEQIMRIATDLAGFTGGQADELRRAIGAWRADGRLAPVAERLFAGLRAKGLSEGFCQRLSEEIKGFAHYGFPESHAASFALLIYASCFLKQHHPAVFTMALINSQPLGFYANHSLIDDLKRHGGVVLPVDPTRSGWDCHLEQGQALRLGLRVAGGLGRAQADALIAERGRRPFSGLDDFVQRSRLGGGLLQRLALGDAFACFGLSPRAAYWEVLRLLAFRQGPQKRQLGLFEHTESLLPAASALPLAALSPWQRVQRHYGAFGASAEAHPMLALRSLLPSLPPQRCADAKRARSGSLWTQAGFLIVRQRPGSAEGVVFATLEDESGLLDLVLHPKVYEKYRDEFLEHQFFVATGLLQRDQDSVSVLLHRLQAVEPEKALAAQAHNWH